MAGSEAAGAGGRRGEEEAAAGAAPHMARPAWGGGEAGPEEPGCGWRGLGSDVRRTAAPAAGTRGGHGARSPGAPCCWISQDAPPAPSACSSPRPLGAPRSGQRTRGPPGRGLPRGHPGGGDEAYALEHPRGCGAGKACQRYAWSSLLYPPGFFEGAQTLDSRDCFLCAPNRRRLAAALHYSLPAQS